MREAGFRDSALFVRLGIGLENFCRQNIPIFRNCAIIPLFQRSEARPWNTLQTPGRRLNVLGKAERRKRIFARLREGWAYEEIAGEERVSAERIRQIVSEVLDKRVIDRGVDHAHLQLERLMPALRIVGEAIGRGELKAVAPLIKVIDRLDKHQQTVVAKYTYGPEERQRLLDKINRLADNLQPLDREAPAQGPRSRKIFSAKFPRKPLKRLDSDERIQGNPSFSNPSLTGAFAAKQRRAKTIQTGGSALRAFAVAFGNSARELSWPRSSRPSTPPRRNDLCRQTIVFVIR